MSVRDDILDMMAQKSMIDRSRLTTDIKLADLNMSSLDMVEVMFAFEEKFGVDLPFNANTRTDNIETVGDVIALIEKRIDLKRQAAAR